MSGLADWFRQLENNMAYHAKPYDQQQREQAEREAKAKALSQKRKMTLDGELYYKPLNDGIPLTLAEQFNLNPRMQSYMDHLQANDETEQKDTEILNNIIRDVGMPPKYFFERNILQNMQQNRARSLYEMYRNGGI